MSGKTKYETIIFLQGDDYDEAMRECGAYVPDEPAVIRRYGEQWDALFEHLRQWDYGEPTDEQHDEPPGGSVYDTDDSRDGYIVTWDSRYGCCSLTRVLTDVEDDEDDEDDEDGCDGHESLAGAHMGETVYCDGSCVRR